MDDSAQVGGVQVDDLLVEIGTEELPPKALQELSEAFSQGIGSGLEKAHLTHVGITSYATPRRLAAKVRGLALAQAPRESLRRGPSLNAAFDSEGRPTQAAMGFARSCGVDINALERLETDQGTRLAFRATEPGQPAERLIPPIVREALAELPIPKRMRWGAGTEEFVRPVHWVVLLLGARVVEATILGVAAGRNTRGHRFYHPGVITLPAAASYPEVLKAEGFVLPEFEKRRERIRAGVEAHAKDSGGSPVIDPVLLDEVTALCEWPVAIGGGFDPKFLDLPSEVLVATLKDHQRCFHVVDRVGRLLPSFIAVANIESRRPETVRRGNERVVAPRLSDAAFFWDQDRRKSLDQRRELLRGAVFQKQLGTLYDKTQRIARLARAIATAIGADPDQAERAGLLSKCDLMADLVAEFPQLQGIMGRHYAAHDGEPAEVAAALEEQYLPRFAGDRLPLSPTGQSVALADKLDTLLGVFGIGEVPSGDRDPFALRRAAVGALRIIIEHRLDLDLEDLLGRANAGYGNLFEQQAVVPRVYDFMMERLRSLCMEANIGADVFEAVLARRPTRPLDFTERLRAVMEFRKLPEAESLAAANKRIANILKQAQEPLPEALIESLLHEDAERRLGLEMTKLQATLGPKLRQRDYTGVLRALAALRDSVDCFFDQVLVLCEDRQLRSNRLALLRKLNSLFLDVADISRLQSSTVTH